MAQADTTAASHCTACEAGKFQDLRAQNDCKLCPGGQHQSDEGQTHCDLCLHGQFAPFPSSGQVGASGQPIGSTGPNVACEVCAEGKFAGEGQAECSDCPVGKFQSSPGTCEFCEAGQYKDWVGMLECKHCPSGKFQDGEEFHECKSCPPGKYGPESAGALPLISVCEVCDAGRFAAGHGQTECEQCQAGQYSTSMAIECKECALGQYSNADSPACEACVPGQYQSQAGQAECVDCTKGKYSHGVGETAAHACKACEPGQYAAEAGSANCADEWTCCAPGTFLFFESDDAPAWSPGVCEQCPSGKFQDSQQCMVEGCKDHRKSCPAGQFLDGATAQQDGTCKACPAGKYKVEGAALDTCESCTEGRYGSEAGHHIDASTGADKVLEVCKECAVGQYAASKGNAACATCATGKYTDEHGLRLSCKDCTALEEPVFGVWSTWSTCSARCGGGTQTRSRSLTMNPADQCLTHETRDCNTDACAPVGPCKQVRCRFWHVDQYRRTVVQAWHPVHSDSDEYHKDSDKYHRCVLEDAANGSQRCQCTCYENQAELDAAKAQAASTSSTADDAITDRADVKVVKLTLNEAS